MLIMRRFLWMVVSLEFGVGCFTFVIITLHSIEFLLFR